MRPSGTGTLLAGARALRAARATSRRPTARSGPSRWFRARPRSRSWLAARVFLQPRRVVPVAAVHGLQVDEVLVDGAGQLLLGEQLVHQRGDGGEALLGGAQV